MNSHRHFRNTAAALAFLAAMAPGAGSAAAMMASPGATGASAMGSAAEDNPAPNAVYTMSNAAEGNLVLMYRRAANGQLAQPMTFLTGGTGTGAGLGNGHGLVLSDDGRWLITVNAGSNDLSVFAVTRTGLRRTAIMASGGTRPVSVTLDDDLVYVLNAGSDNLAGFRLNYKGELRALAGSARPLSGTGVGAAEISFSPDGRNLVVTEKTTNRVLVYPVGTDGLPAQSPKIVASAGTTPFGFTFAGRSTLLVAEAAGAAANASSVSAYRLDRSGDLDLIEGTVPTHQTAACWIEAVPFKPFAYTANTPSSSISGFRVDARGDLTPLSDTGATATPGDGSRPIDLAFSRDGKFLYSLNSGTQSLGIFKVSGRGALTPMDTVAGLPGSANGLAAR